MLSVDHATPFLLERGLIDRSWVIDGGLTIRCSERRNRNLKVEGPGGTGCLIKQPGDPAEGGHDTLGSEAEFYRFCQKEPVVTAMKQIAPNLVYYDPDRATFALELVSDAATLWWHYSAQDAQESRVEIASAFGRALGTVHQIFRRPGLVEDPRLAWLGCVAPWVMTVHRPGPELIANLSPANSQLIRILQTQNGLAERLDRVRGQWRAETVIHGDIKSDNVLAWRSREQPAWEIRIVDWEMVQLGDPAWDLAGALQDFVDCWVSSMPLANDMTLDERVAQARCPLHLVHAAIRSMWHGYQAATALASPEADDLLHRAMQYSAARIIQTVYETSYRSPQLSPRSVILLQISANLLSEPELVRAQLYGIPLASSQR